MLYDPTIQILSTCCNVGMAVAIVINVDDLRQTTTNQTTSQFSRSSQAIHEFKQHREMTTMNIIAKRTRVNGNKVVSVYVNNSLFESFMDQVTLTYGRLGQVDSKVVTAESQAEDCVYNLNRRLNKHSI